MDSPDFPTAGTGGTAKSPRTLHGPRPTPLRVHKDSHKITKKPPVAPPQHHHHHHHRHPQQTQPQPYHRPPVIIYTVSPKVIHTNPNEFMNLVQRLTGPSPSSPFHDAGGGGGTVSPAARFASLQKAASPPASRKFVPQNGDVAAVEGVEINTGLEYSGYFPGILSPGPASLPPIPPSFFSPLANDQNPLSFYPDLSPVFHNTRNYNYFEGNNSNNIYNNNSFIMPSPSSNLLSPYIVSPATLNLFNTLFD